MKTRISPLIFLLAIIMILLGQGFIYAVYLVTILLHELAHAYVANKCGYVLHTLNLMPYGASLTVDLESVTPKDEIKIALAGPLVNLIICLISVSIWWIVPQSYYFTEAFVYASASIFLINLLPIYPLDGARIVLALVSKKYKRAVAYKFLNIISLILTSILLIIGVILLYFHYINVTFMIFLIFLLGSTIIKDDNSKYQHLFSLSYRYENLKNGMIVREMLISSEARLIDIMKNIDFKYYYKFIIVDSHMNEVKKLNEKDIYSLITHGHLNDIIKNLI